MRRIKELLTEYEIRFKETDEILESSAFNDKNIINKKNYVPQINELRVSNKNGQVYDQKKGWATAKLTEKPGKWVIERNENHPMWVEFMAWWNEKYSSTLFNEKMVKYIQNNGKGLFELVNAENHQYLTLDQWAEFFLLTAKDCTSFHLETENFYPNRKLVDSINEILELRKPTDKELNILYEKHPEYAPFGVFGDDYEVSKSTGRLERIESGRYCSSEGGWWKNFTPFSPELQEMLNKEINEIK